MKTSTIIIAAILSFQANVLLAGINEPSSRMNARVFFCPTCFLTPVIPAEATFEDDVTGSDIVNLAPVIPDKAGFSDSVLKTVIDLKYFTFVTPAEAEFE